MQEDTCFENQSSDTYFRIYRALHLVSSGRRPEILSRRYADKRELKIEASLIKILLSMHSSFYKTAKRHESFLSLEVSFFY